MHNPFEHDAFGAASGIMVISVGTVITHLFLLHAIIRNKYRDHYHYLI